MKRVTSKPTGVVHRREFLKTGGALTAAAAVGFPMIVPRHVLSAPNKPGANDRIRVAAIGVGGRATMLLHQLPAGAQLVALCDCNESRAEAFKHNSRKAAEDKTKINWQIYQDHHKLLERKDIDAVLVGTADFQRVSPCIDACQAGKDVYAEKPLTLYIQEGRALVDAVRRHDRIFQVGSQQRSMAMNHNACELIRSGRLGKVLQVRAVDYWTAGPFPSATLPEEPVPQGLNWDRWLNQLPMRPFNKGWMPWHNWREFGGGLMTNWGAHGVDQIQCALGTDGTGPVEIWPLGPAKQLETGHLLQPVGMRYANGVEVHFVLPDTGPMGGAVFVCEKGKLEINRNKYSSNPKSIAEELNKKVDVAEEGRKWSDVAEKWTARIHLQNWLDCIRTRQRPVADVEIGHRSVSICHLANITRWVNRRLKWDPVKEQFIGDDEANTYVTRTRRKGYELPKAV